MITEKMTERQMKLLCNLRSHPHGFEVSPYWVATAASCVIRGWVERLPVRGTAIHIATKAGLAALHDAERE